MSLLSEFKKRTGNMNWSVEEQLEYALFFIEMEDLEESFSKSLNYQDPYLIDILNLQSAMDYWDDNACSTKPEQYLFISTLGLFKNERALSPEKEYAVLTVSSDKHDAYLKSMLYLKTHQAAEKEGEFRCISPPFKVDENIFHQDEIEQWHINRIEGNL